MQTSPNENRTEKRPMELSRVILEYIKALIWPTLLVAAFYFYSDNLFEIIKSREIDAFGVKIGKQIDEISKNYEDQIAQLKQQLEQANTSPQLLNKVQSIENNLDKQLSHIKSTALFDQQSLVSLSKKDKVSRFERNGFEAILNTDIETAISSFEAAKELWPDYHNVTEIAAFLKNTKSELTVSNETETWENIFVTILDRYSWGMPKDIREKIEESIQ